MTLITTLEGFVLSIPAFFSNALQAFTTFIQKTTGISPSDLHHILRWTSIFLLAFFLFLISKRLYHLWLPGHFARRYGISRLPKHTIIKRRFRLPLTRNSYVLRFPSWRYANQDKTRDQRRKGNKINWKNSCLMIDSYKIFMKNPMQMVRLVRHLREEGYEILPCAIEIEKKRLLRKSDDTYRSGSSRELHKRFQEDPFAFEEYCAALFRAMGKRAHTTPRTNDGGYDVIVQKLVGACMAYPIRLDYLIFVTTSDFSEEARTFAQDFQKREKISFSLINGQTLSDLSEKYLSESSSRKKMKRPIDDWKQWQLTTADLKEYVPPDLYDRL